MNKRFIGSVLVGGAAGVLLTVVAYQLSGTSFTVGGLELLLFLTTIVSMGFNVWQFVRERERHEPLKNSLITLFNDLKSRQVRCHARQERVARATDANYRAEFLDFLEEMKYGLEQMREHVAGAIRTLDPMISNEAIFRAAEFGLTDAEREYRARWTGQVTDRSARTPAPGSDVPVEQAVVVAAEPAEAVAAGVNGGEGVRTGA